MHNAIGASSTRGLLTMLLGITLLVPAPGTAQTPAELPGTVESDGTRVSPDLIMVRMRPGANPAVIRERAQAVGISSFSSLQSEGAASLERAGFRVVRVDPADRDTALVALASSPDISLATPVKYRRSTRVPSDPQFAKQYHHANIRTPAAWDVSYSGQIAPIAVLDSGVDATHPELAGRVLSGYNVVMNNGDTRPVTAHGTIVAGTAGANANNGHGGAGVAWGARILPVMIASDGGWARDDHIAIGMLWAADHGARIVNISYGPLQDAEWFRDYCAYLRARNVLVVVSAGNTGLRHEAPADPNALYVGASDAANDLASFSTTGPSVDLVAPGVNILAPHLDGLYVYASGTSFAAPLVTGAAALVWGASPWLDADQVEEVLLKSTRDLGDPGFDEKFGRGLLNVEAAVKLAYVTPSRYDFTPPAVSISGPGSGRIVHGPVTVQVNATDATRVAAVELFVNGVRHAVDSMGPYTFRWDTSGLREGTYTLEAHARDLNGNVGTSAAVVVNVVAPLAARFAFEEGQGQVTRDASGNNVNAILGLTQQVEAGYDPVWTAGQTGRGLAFAGARHLRASGPLTGGMAAVSLEGWSRRSADSTAGWKTLIARYEAGVLRYGLFTSSTGHAHATYRNAAGAVLRVTSAAGAIPQDRWAHVTATLGAAGLRLYIDGKLVTQTTGSGNLAVGSTGTLVIGQGFRGSLDRIAISRRLLTESEVVAHARP